MTDPFITDTEKNTLHLLEQIKMTTDNVIHDGRNDILDAIIKSFSERAKAYSAAVKKIEASILSSQMEKIEERFKSKGEDFGKVSVDLGDFILDVTKPKSVSWDQDILKEAVLSIEDNGDDPSEYVKIAYSVEEKKFSAWPENIKSFFEKGRTVKHGATKIALKKKD